ncbi:MAG TPA: amino acid adenylation domain-containing protein [Pseudonocardiaceae bacterium]
MTTTVPTTVGQLKIAAAQWPAQARHWRRVLAGLAEPGCFPGDLTESGGDPAGPAGAGPSASGHPGTGGTGAGPTETVRVGLDAALVSALRRVGRDDQESMRAVVTAGLVALLARYTGSEDVVLGRPAPDTEGPNTELALRCAVSPGEPFRALLLRVREVTLEALRHQDYPLALFAEGRPHVFDVALAWDESFPVDVPLLVTVVPAGDGYALDLRHRTSRFVAASVRRIAEHLLVLLRAVLADPDAPIGAVDLRTPQDRALLARVNDTAVEYAADLRLDQLFARRVAERPDAVAVVGDGVRLTYAELDRRVNRLARTLRARGVGRDDVVAVLAPRSVEMLVAVHAVLRAGGAYLPVDPAYPAERIRYLLTDSAASVVLTHDPATLRTTPWDGGGQAGPVVLDLTDEDSYAADDSPPEPIGDSRDLAYVIYTSGSTGNPKGAMVEHHSVVNRLAWMQRAYPIGPGDVILQKTPISFDVSVWELFWWSVEGAAVCLLRPGGEKDPLAIVDAVREHGVTTLHFVPSMLAAFLGFVEHFGRAADLAGLRRVFASGEALGAHQVRHLEALLGGHGTDLVNLYGPTEATVDVSFYDTRRHAAEHAGRTVPIGRPIDNTRLYVLGEGNLPQPVGVPGELCIAGVGLARGYLRRPELTAERFVARPFDGVVTDLAEERVYRTGDVARLLPDGELEYLGRIDHQVKVRGFRIELGEIEQRLRDHPAVRDAVVVARDGADGQKALCGYVTVSAPVTEEVLRAHLGGTLPEYMVPPRVLELAEFPLSPNGKLDRRALPAPAAVVPDGHVAPRTEAERVMAGIWGDVLGVPDVGVHDNFFALGGNSIHFVTVLARARAAGLTFTFQQLFGHPTVAGLLAVAPAPAAVADEPSEPEPFALISAADRAALPQDVDDAYPMTMLQIGLIYQSEITTGTAQYHDIISYLIGAPFDAAVFAEAVRVLVRRNPILRTSYHLTGYERPLQLVHAEIPAPLEVHDLRHLDAAAQDEWYQDWLARMKSRSFTWGQVGLVTLHVHVLADDRYRYNISLHNSALDGWSINLVHTEVFAIYRALLAGGSYAEPEPRNHLRDYVALELAALESLPDKEFWAGVLRDRPFTPVPRSAGADGAYSVVMRDVPLPDGLSDRLIALADELSVPVKNVLLAAHVAVMGELAGQREVLTGYEHAGRPEVEHADRAIGMFLNSVPLRLRLDAGTWAELIDRVYRAEIELLPHRRYPMARMKQDVGTREPLFESVFNYTHFYPLRELRELPEFSLLDVRAESETEFVLRTEFSRHFFHDDVRLSLHYHANLVSRADVDAMAGRFLRVLTAMVETPHAAPRLELPPDGEPGAGRSAGDGPSSGGGPDGRTPRARRSGPPATEAERRIAGAWSHILGVPAAHLGRDADFFALGGNSLSALRVVMELDGAVSLIDLMRTSRLADLAEIAGAGGTAGGESGDEGLVRVLRTPAGRPTATLVCVPYAGGNAANFVPFADALAEVAPGLAVRAVELPGHDLRRPGEPMAGVPAIAAAVAGEIAATVDGPVLLWGHCVGSAVALETARLLEHRGADLRRVYLAGKLFPGVDRLRANVAEVTAMTDEQVGDWLVHNTGFAEFAALRGDAATLLARTFRHDAAAGNTYLADHHEDWLAHPLTTPCVVVAAADDPFTPGHAEEYGNWRGHAPDLRLAELPDGGHYFARTRPAATAALLVETSPEVAR